MLLVPFALPIGYLVALKKGEDADFFERLGFVTFPTPPEKTVWFHCASVGEVRSLKVITDMMTAEMPDVKVIISTTTATGKAEAVKLIQPYHAFLLPIENPMAVAHIIEYMNVKALILIDTELWPNLISSASKHTKLFLFNARLSDRSVKSYRRYRFFFARLLNKFEHIYTKSDDDTAKFISVTDDKSNVSTLGNIKFQTRKLTPEPEHFGFLKGLSIFAAASTHPGEEKTAIDAFIQAKAQDRLVIAPRHKNRNEDAKNAAKEAGLTVSMLNEKDSTTEVVIVDRFGTLDELYSISDRIFVGGSMNATGGHNIYEALQFRKPVCVGPNMSNFHEIFYLAEKFGAVTTVKNSDEMAAYLKFGINSADFDGLFGAVDHRQQDIIHRIKEVIAACIC